MKSEGEERLSRHANVKDIYLSVIHRSCHQTSLRWWACLSKVLFTPIREGFDLILYNYSGCCLIAILFSPPPRPFLSLSSKWGNHFAYMHWHIMGLGRNSCQWKTCLPLHLPKWAPAQQSSCVCSAVSWQKSPFPASCYYSQWEKDQPIPILL